MIIISNKIYLLPILFLLSLSIVCATTDILIKNVSDGWGCANG